MNKKKKRFLSIVALLIILCSPLYDWIPPWPKTITLYGNMPPESHLKAVVPYYTESFLCRDFSFGSGSFLSSGKWNRRYSTISDVKGNYEISVPIEMQSPFCKWENRGINIYFSPPNADVEVNSETYKILNINLTGNNKEMTLIVPINIGLLMKKKIYMMLYVDHHNIQEMKKSYINSQMQYMI